MEVEKDQPKSEWKKTKHILTDGTILYVPVSEKSDIEGCWIHPSLLDQLRREAVEKVTQDWTMCITKSPMSLLIDIMIDEAVKKAKKELLDEIHSALEPVSGDDDYMLTYDSYYKIRAKTLGEK